MQTQRGQRLSITRLVDRTNVRDTLIEIKQPCE